MKKALCFILTIMIALSLFAPGAAVSAAGKIADGTMIYYEDFERSDISGNDKVLSALGWTLSEGLKTNTAQYSITGGKLLCDNLTSTVGGTTNDSYVTVLDDAAMKDAAKGDYTISYDVTYLAAEDAQRYVAMIYNYNGFNNYNTVHIRVGGTGNNQVRIYGSTYKTYDSVSGTDAPGYLASNGANSVSQKVFGIASGTSSPYPLIEKTFNVTVKVDKDKGPTVYVNGIKLSEPNSVYAELFSASQTYSSAVALKTSVRVKAYVDNLAVYTGLGDMPTDKKVTYSSTAAAVGGIPVMSFNILYSNGNDVAFSDGLKRTEHIVSVVSGMHPYIIGFQERTNSTMKSGVTDQLKNFGYAVTDDYRTDSTSSNVICATPIMYDTAKFELVANSSANGNMAHGNYVYKNSYQTTGKTISPTTVYTKSLAWAVLKDKASGQLILAMNTHFAVSVSSYTNYSSADAVRDRIENAKQAIETLDKVYAQFGQIPAFFTGDFNMRQQEEAYRLLQTRFGDSIHLAPDTIYYEYSMSNDSSTITNPDHLRPANSPIDHVFVTTENISVNSYNVLNDCREQMIASDHNALLVKLEISPASAPLCSHPTGIYSGTQKVTLNGKGTIYYTLDGSDPRSSSTRKVYSSAIGVSSDTVLRYASLSGGDYSPVKRSTLYFGTPFYATECSKNTAGSDFLEGIEILNVSSVPLDMSDFRMWQYAGTSESAVKNVAPSSVTANEKVSQREGEYVVAPGELVYIMPFFSDHYMKTDVIASGKSVRYVEFDPDTCEVTYRKDYLEKAFAYEKAGNITADRLIIVDRTSRSAGYTAGGAEVRRKDYYDENGAFIVNHIAGSFNLSNAYFNRLFFTFVNDASVSTAFCIFDLDSTGGGTVMDGSTPSPAEGAYYFEPSADGPLMKTTSFTKKSYTVGYLTDAQKPVFAAVNRSGNDKYVKTDAPVEPPVTTSAPVTTAPAPVTTAPAPVTTAPAPVTTAPAPVTTTPATTVAPETTETPVTTALPVTTVNPTSTETPVTTSPETTTAAGSSTEPSGTGTSSAGTDLPEPPATSTADDISGIPADSTSVTTSKFGGADTPDVVNESGCYNAYYLLIPLIVAAVAAVIIIIFRKKKN